jgi:hypothetical protein
MSQPATSIRAAVKKRLVDLIVEQDPRRADGSEVQVLYSPIERDLQDERIFLGATRGTQGQTVFGMGRPWRDDTFTVEVWVETRVAGTSDPYDADVRCLELVAAVENAVAENDLLGFTEDDGVVRVTPTEFDGPEPMQLPNTDEGVASAAKFVVEVHTRTN